MNAHPEHVEAGWNTEPSMPSVGQDGDVPWQQAEAAREERWREAEDALREFAKVEGWPATLRMVSYAMDRKAG